MDYWTQESYEFVDGYPFDDTGVISSAVTATNGVVYYVDGIETAVNDEGFVQVPAGSAVTAKVGVYYPAVEMHGTECEFGYDEITACDLSLTIEASSAVSYSIAPYLGESVDLSTAVYEEDNGELITVID